MKKVSSPGDTEIAKDVAEKWRSRIAAGKKQKQQAQRPVQTAKDVAENGRLYRLQLSISSMILAFSV